MKMKVDNSHIHLDIVGGIAGDMFVSAMLDTFESLHYEVSRSIKRVLPANIGTAVLSKGINSGISGLKFHLQLQGDSNSCDAHEHTHSHAHNQSHSHSHTHEHSSADEHEHQHDHAHEHTHHEHSHSRKHSHAHSHSHETTYKYLCELLTSSSLDEKVIEIAVDLLTIIAKAEAKIHNKTLDDVHFHELADWDSLMDVVAAAVILSALSTCTWSTSKLPLGSGLVNTQHGLIPVPAPATAEILLGFEFIDDGIKGERITPTGAAILKYLSNTDLLTTQPQGKLITTGYGLGTKIFLGMPNILRALHFEKTTVVYAEQGTQPDTVVIIEFDIDDMTGEELGLSLDLLRAQQGVVDVIVQSARGKKNRSVESIRLLASCEYYQDIIDCCFNQTTTIGLRYRFETRRHLQREHHDIQGVACKTVTRPNGDTSCKIEHDELTSLTTLNQRRALKYQVESVGKGESS